MLAACWIQFENHDWFSHGDNIPTEHLEVPLAEGDDWGREPDAGRRTTGTPTDRRKLPPTYVNTVTHWWDGSQIYGSSEERNRELRTGEDGKMIVEDDRLPGGTTRSSTASTMTGFSDNYWVGLSMLHTLFVKEHNAICDYLRAPPDAGTTSSCSSPRGW